MKTCYSCGDEKPLTEFHRHRGRKDGHADSCKACATKRMSLYARTEGARAARSKYWNEYKNNPEKRELLQDYHRDYQRSMSVEQKESRTIAAKRRQRKSPRYSLYCMLYSASKRRPTENIATIDDLMDLYQRQNGLCAVSGVKLVWSSSISNGKKLPESISLDRIDNSKGYEIENLRLVCWQVNVFKNCWTDEQMLTMARAIVAKSDESKPHHERLSDALVNIHNMPRPKLKLVS